MASRYLRFGQIGAATVALMLLTSGCAGDEQSAGVATQASAPPTTSLTSAAEIEQVVVPDVVGDSKDEAVAAIEDAGFVARVSGEGSVVGTQRPEGGRSIEAGSTVALILSEPAPDGSRARPFAAGSTIVGSTATVDEASLMIGSATWNADDVVMAENQFNDPAPEGSTYVLVPVTITNVGSADAVIPWLAFDIAYVAPDGRSYDEASAVIPDELSDIGDLYEGGSATGNIAFVLPVDGQGGVWAASYSWSDPVFIVAN